MLLEQLLDFAGTAAQGFATINPVEYAYYAMLMSIGSLAALGLR